MPGDISHGVSPLVNVEQLCLHYISHSVCNNTHVHLPKPFASSHLTSLWKLPQLTSLGFQALAVSLQSVVHLEKFKKVAWKGKIVMCWSQWNASFLIPKGRPYGSLIEFQPSGTMLHNSILTGQGCIDPMSSAPRQAVEYFKPIQTIILHFVLPRSSPLTYICVAAELSTVYHRRWAVLIFITLQNTLFYYSVF